MCPATLKNNQTTLDLSEYTLPSTDDVIDKQMEAIQLQLNSLREAWSIEANGSSEVIAQTSSASLDSSGTEKQPSEDPNSEFFKELKFLKKLQTDSDTMPNNFLRGNLTPSEEDKNNQAEFFDNLYIDEVPESLTTREEVVGYFEDAVGSLMHLAERQVFSSNTILFRGSHGRSLQDKADGDIVHFEGFTSASTDLGIAMVYYGKALYEIHLPKGMAHIDMKSIDHILETKRGGAESEIVLLPQKYKLVRREKREYQKDDGREKSINVCILHPVFPE